MYKTGNVHTRIFISWNVYTRIYKVYTCKCKYAYVHGIYVYIHVYTSMYVLSNVYTCIYHVHACICIPGPDSKVLSRYIQLMIHVQIGTYIFSNVHTYLNRVHTQMYHFCFSFLVCQAGWPVISDWLLLGDTHFKHTSLIGTRLCPPLQPFLPEAFFRRGKALLPPLAQGPMRLLPLLRRCPWRLRRRLPRRPLRRRRCPLASSGKAACVDVLGLRAGAVPGRWFGVHFLWTPNQLERQELGLGANANTSEDALWWCCCEMRKNIDFSQHNIILCSVDWVIMFYYLQTNKIFTWSAFRSVSEHDNATGNENSSLQFMNTFIWIVGLIELHEKSIKIEWEQGINHTIIKL